VYLNSKFNGSEVVWWNYMGNHRELCRDDLSEECSKDVHELMSISF